MARGDSVHSSPTIHRFLMPVSPLLSNLKSFQQALIAWFKDHGKDYPWRRTTDGYAILVSEMMLQQTQISSVLGKGYYKRWMEQFPTIQSLAEADESTLLRAWEGLGYYQRARNLQRTAKQIMAQGASFPDTAQALAMLPGIGRYTAGAVATFAFNAPEPIIDANITRVLSRLFDFHEPTDSTAGRQQLWDWATTLVPKKDARLYNSGLMELGQVLCKPKAPDCEQCPVSKFCLAKNHSPESLPVKSPKTPTVHLTEHIAWTVRNGQLLLAQEKGKRRQGLWKLPERPASHFNSSRARLLHTMSYSITHFRVKSNLYSDNSIQELDHESFHPFASLPQLPMPAPYRRIIEVMDNITKVY